MPRVFSPTGTYDDRLLDRARAYRLLAHAEIEAFVEDIAKAAVIKRLSEWKNKRTPSQLIISFLASYHAGFAADENDASTMPVTSRPFPKERIDDVIEKATIQYMNRIAENHGVRADNLRRVFLPVGVDFDALDQTWLTAIDEFGKRRGEVAHKTIGAQQAIDPKTEYQNIQVLLLGLKELDAVVIGLAQ